MPLIAWGTTTRPDTARVVQDCSTAPVSLGGLDMSFKKMFVGLAAAVMVIGGFATPASAAPNSDSATQALNNLGLLSAAPEDTADAPGSEAAPSSSLTTSTLRVESKAGAVGISPVTSASGSISEDRAVTILAESDASYALTSQSAGAHANAGYVVLHNESAPKEFRFRVTANDRPAVLSLIDGRVLVSDQNGDPVNVFGSAWAKDANGNDVATSYSVDGDTLIQSVATTKSTAYPVVADPRVQCDLVWCTLEFTRTETRTASETAAGATGVLCAGAALLNPIVGFVCGAYGAAFWVAAVQAKNTGQCAGFRMLAIGGSAHPVIIRCYG